MLSDADSAYSQGPMDHSAGRAHLLDGRWFYSPNCSRDIEAPPPQPGHFTTSGIFQQPTPRLHHYLTPVWWTAPFGYLSFLPLHPSFVGYPFDRLAHVPPLGCVDGKFLLNPALAEGWLRLQHKLVAACCVLTAHYPVVGIRPFHPSAWGFTAPHAKYAFARQRAIIARDWFVILMANLSFLVATGESDPVWNGEGMPDWFTRLHDAGFDQLWLAGVKASQVGTFGLSVPRVGLFLDFMNPEKTQPDVQWFCHHHVPVWYPWGAYDEATVRAKQFADLIPPAHKLQAAATFMTRNPSALPTQPSLPDSTSLPALPVKRNPPAWKAFFEERDKLNARKLEKETAKQREKRLNRERRPPVRTAPVFEWVESENDPTQLVRKPVFASAREETLDFYGKDQTRYDAFWNEWDCFEALPAGNEDGDEGSCAELPQIDADRTHEPPTSGLRSPSPRPIVEHQPFLEDTPDMTEALQALRMHYGFVPPLPMPLKAEQVDPKAREIFLRATGLSQTDDALFTTGLGKVAHSFIQDLASKRQPDQSLWDLRKGNRDALALKRPVYSLRFVPSGFILFDFGRSSTVPWTIATSQSATALYICRLDLQFDELDIARSLLHRGMPFNTFQPLKDVAPSPPHFDLSVPMRLSGYTFTKRDYDAYLHQRAAILSGGAGRAALLRGGILWRLAVPEISVDSVLRGPSPSVLVHRDGVSVEDPDLGNRLWDDELSEDAILLICGTYKCFTGM
jgi:hypothetical protein